MHIRRSGPLFALALSLVLCLALGMSACGRSQEADKAPAAPPPPTPGAARASAAPEAVRDVEPQPAAAAQPSPVAQGAELYGRMCAVCHGANGEGYKADQATALAQQDFLASVSDEALGTAIATGRPGTQMSAWYREAGGPLSERDVRALMAFIRSWQKQPPVTLDEQPPKGDATRGKAIYKKQCERCHGEKGPNVRIRERTFLSTATVGFLRHALHTGRPPTPMLSFTKTLGERGIEDVLAYLMGLPRWPTPGSPGAAQMPPPLPLGPVPLNPKGPVPKGFHMYPTMTAVDTVFEQYARKARMVLLDARVPSDYVQTHIAGAVSVPFYDPTPYLDALPKDSWLVCYCGCPHAESGALAEKLIKAGFKQVTVLDEGLGDWMAKMHPTSTGEQP